MEFCAFSAQALKAAEQFAASVTAHLNVRFATSSRFSNSQTKPGPGSHYKGSGRQATFALERNRGPAGRARRYTVTLLTVVETVFGNISTNKRLQRFSLRGKKKL